MATLDRRNEVFEKGNIVNVTYDFTYDDGSTNTIGIGVENLNKTEAEQEQIAIDIFNGTLQTVEIKEINKEI